ncbi:MAG: transposase [Acidobacteriota bacterium]
MSLSSRRELLSRVAHRYNQASWSEKGRILDEFVAATGYGRKHAVTLLNHPPRREATRKRCRQPRIYDEAVREALVKVWKAANRICSKRLIPFLPEFVVAMERFGHLSLEKDVRDRLLTMSPATADRLLFKERHPEGIAVATTRPGALLKRRIQVRTFADWDDVSPGFLEADLVAHCGGTTEGAFLHTLVLTDVSSGWTECIALLRRSEADVIGAINAVGQILPFPLLGLDTDNGSEFINYELVRYCEREKITFTRSRVNRKNDQAHVEEKNGSVVRRLVGYDRYEGLDAWHRLRVLYQVLRLYLNFFQPSLKLLSKQRWGGRVKKRYDQAKTPCQRLLASPDVTGERKNRLCALYKDLDPVALLRELEHLQDRFWLRANAAAGGVGLPTPLESMRPEPSPELKASAPVRAATAEPTKTPRMYRRTKKPRAPRTWRTRKDPFAEVWQQVRLQLQLNPSQTAKQLFQDLRDRHPGRFQDGQLRTLQRRVRQWRREQLYSDPAMRQSFYANILPVAQAHP